MPIFMWTDVSLCSLSQHKVAASGWILILVLLTRVGFTSRVIPEYPSVSNPAHVYNRIPCL